MVSAFIKTLSDAKDLLGIWLHLGIGFPLRYI